MSNNRSTKKKHYLDTCIFIGYLNQEENKFSECNAVISAASEGFIEAFTSELIGVELIKLNGFPSGAENAMNQFLDDFISKSHWLKLISFEREMAMKSYLDWNDFSWLPFLKSNPTIPPLE